MFFLNVPLEGAESEFTQTFYIKVLLKAFLYSCLFFIIRWAGSRLARKENRLGMALAKAMPFCNLVVCLVSIAILVSSGFRINKMFQVSENLNRQYNREVSQFYEDFYVAPEKAMITPPSDKQQWNLIVVYLESMEKTFSDKKLMQRNLIPQLSRIAEENQSFSHFMQGYGQFPTQSALVSSMISVPTTYLMRIGNPLRVGGSLPDFAPNAFSIGQLLEGLGYQNLYVQGTSGRFSGIDVFLKSHGFEAFYDIRHLTERFESDYQAECLKAKIRKRFYDRFTYDFFKEKILSLPHDKPFFAVMATIDTHFGNANPPDKNHFPTTVQSTIYEASRMAGEFLEWVREQPFGKKTVVVFIGDHLLMRAGGRRGEETHTLFKNSPDESRFIFNAFVNARKKAPDLSRRFTQVDMFPTLVEALGYEIKGHRLGLGTSLFSMRPTLVEELGKTKLSDELRKKNRLYDSLWEAGKD
ncbi:MAG: LTA synthase family protein [Alistipes senegalensis]|nr:LTA synthase family protein [Oxalobacter formigenes]MCM1281704.1 LTA synthase family protein [Alistipes senegalensis]